MDAQAIAKGNKAGIWSVEQKSVAPVASGKQEMSQIQDVKIRLSEIRSGSHFFYQVVGDDAANVMEQSMKEFTSTHGTGGAPCDEKVNKVVAALFDDGNGKSWYRAKILERKGTGKVSVLFLDHGNVATVPISTHLRPLDVSLGTDRIPPVAREASRLGGAAPLNALLTRLVRAAEAGRDPGAVNWEETESAIGASARQGGLGKDLDWLRRQLRARSG